MLKIIYVLVLLILFTISSAVAEDSEIKIGSILILTGEGASWGNAAKNGIDMAIADINAKGGINGKKLIVYHQDDQGDPKKSISAFRHLTDVEGVLFIIGGTWSNLGIPLIDLARKKKTIIISPSLGVASFNEAHEFLFNTWPHDFILSQALADYVYKKGHRNVALVGAEHVWVNEQTGAFKRRFEELGGKISFLTEPLPGSTDLRSEALKIKNTKGVDAYVSTTDGVTVGSLVAKSLKEMNVKLPTYSITLDQAAIDAAQGGFEGLEFLTFLTPTLQFQNEYETKFKITIDIGADTAYDAVMMLRDAFQETNSTDTTVISKKLADIKSYQGASGNLTSDGKRGFMKEYAVKKVVAGKPASFALPK